MPLGADFVLFLARSGYSFTTGLRYMYTRTTGSQICTNTYEESSFDRFLSAHRQYAQLQLIYGIELYSI